MTRKPWHLLEKCAPGKGKADDGVQLEAVVVAVAWGSLVPCILLNSYTSVSHLYLKLPSVHSTSVYYEVPTLCHIPVSFRG